MTLRITPELRKELKKPFGKIRRIKKNEQFKKLVAVGDTAAYAFIKQGITPHLIIYDGKELRKKASKESQNAIKGVKADIIEVNNPAGTIQEEVWTAVYFGLKKRTKIRVRGEEDLLVIPVVKMAKKGTTVCYGQPRKGLVFLEVTETAKNRIDKLINRMEVE